MGKAKKRKRPGGVRSQDNAKGRIDASEEELGRSLRNTPWGKSKLTEFLTSAEQNTKITYLQQKGYFELFDGLAELFWKTSHEVGYHDVPSFVRCLLFYRCVGSLLAAIRLGSAGQLPECYTQLRLSLESALYAFAIQEEPALAEAWMNRHNDERSRKTCQKSFVIGDFLQKLASRDKSLHAEVKQLYEETIDCGGHPNERSLTTNIVFDRRNQKMVLELLNTQAPAFHVCLSVCSLAGLSAGKILSLVYHKEFARINGDIRMANIKSQLQRIAPTILLDLSDGTGDQTKKPKV